MLCGVRCASAQSRVHRTKESIDIIRKRMSVSTVWNLFSWSAQSEYRRRAMSTEEIDQFSFVFLRDRMSQNEQIETPLFALLKSICAAKGRGHKIALTAKEHLARAK
jgi:hypothetical protein